MSCCFEPDRLFPGLVCECLVGFDPFVEFHLIGLRDFCVVHDERNCNLQHKLAGVVDYGGLSSSVHHTMRQQWKFFREAVLVFVTKREE